MAIVNGTSGADTMLGSAGDDTFYASTGDDRIWGGLGGYDVLHLTGSFDDYTIRDNGNGSYTITDLRAGGDGVDVVRAIDSFVFTDRTLTLGEFVAQGRNIVEGGSGDDDLNGAATNDVFIGGAGNDRIWGGTGGEDTVVYTGRLDDYDIRANDDGSYTITDRRGLDGVDTIRDIDQFRFSDGVIDLDGFLAMRPSEFRGTAGDDILQGTSGNDHFFSSAGDDRYWGKGRGDDLITYSGKFSDYAIVDNRNGSYTIVDTRDGSPDGTDVVRDIQTFEFADRNATLSEFLAAHPSDFILDGRGTSGDDVLHGGAGDDVLQGMGGRDRIWGGKDGYDTVVFRGNFADYVVTDNANGAYTVTDIRGDSPDGVAVVRDVELYQFADVSIKVGDLLTMSQQLADQLKGTIASDVMSGAHTRGLFDAHSNDSIVGGGGNDTIRGGPGHDYIVGDGGTETGSSEAPGEASENLSSSPVFTDATVFYQVRNGQLFAVDPLTGQSTVIGDDHHNYDAVGINPVDGYAYGVGHSGPWTGHLLRIASDGHVESLGSGFHPAKSGGFAGDGTLYLRTGTQEMTLVDVATLTQTQIAFTGENPPAVNDIVFIPNETNGTFYGITVNGTLVAYDLTTLTVSTASIDGALVAGGPYGSGWASEDGGLYFSHNRTGNIYAISGLENMNPVAALLAVGGASNSSDGFAIGGLALPVDVGEDGSDLLLGGAGSDHLVGGLGRDFLDGGTGADVLDGGADIDTADYSRAAEGVNASLAEGGIAGEAAGDTYIAIENLLGSWHNDILVGDGQDNEITGRAGDDTISGGMGNDVLRGEEGADHLDGGDGFDIASYYSATDGIGVDLSTGLGFAGEASGDRLVNIEAVQGSNTGNDTLLGSAGEDVLSGFGGNDVIDGRGGNDDLRGGDGDDVISGGEGNDLLLGQDGSDYLMGGDGADNIQGGNGNDTMLGGAGVDRLWGAAGDDVLDGGAGDDFLRGGEGSDTFVFHEDSGNDKIMDFTTGIDRIDLSGISGIDGWDDLTVRLIEPQNANAPRAFDIAYIVGESETHLHVQLDASQWARGVSLAADDFLF